MRMAKVLWLTMLQMLGERVTPDASLPTHDCASAATTTTRTMPSSQKSTSGSIARICTLERHTKSTGHTLPLACAVLHTNTRHHSTMVSSATQPQSQLHWLLRHPTHLHSQALLVCSLKSLQLSTMRTTTSQTSSEV